MKNSSRKFYQRPLIIALIAIPSLLTILLVVVAILIPDDYKTKFNNEYKKAEAEKEAASKPKHDPVKDSIEFVNDINKKIEYLNGVGAKSGNRINGTWQEIGNELTLLQAEYIASCLKPLATEKPLIKLMKQYETALKDVMILNYEQARILYVAEKNDLLFENDVTIDPNKKYNELTLIGAMFAANKNKVDAKKMMEPAVELLRIKRLNFKWYKYDDGYGWTYATPDDDEIQ
jgi:hypothetical protein